jgi:DNA polymerase III delta prime subunit
MATNQKATNQKATNQKATNQKAYHYKEGLIFKENAEENAECSPPIILDLHKFSFKTSDSRAEECAAANCASLARNGVNLADMGQISEHDHTPFIAKYAPQYLRDFLCEYGEFSTRESGVEYVLKTLIDMDDMNVILVGGFNSGKTTMLYALAREYYRSSKGGASLSENNVLFINNLKEQGIQFFRNDMKTFCQTHCSIPGKKKVILIDDMDSINKQSQQVFRNYIDKHKQHVCVVASCSNLQKVVESLQSRLHIVRIEPPTKRQIASMMDKIISKEAITVDRGCREFLLERSNDNICNVINNLEKLAIYGRDGVILSRDVCEKLCSTISFHQFELYLQAVLSGDLREANRVIYSLYDYGYSVIDILEYFFEFVKTTGLIEEFAKYKVVPHICESISIFHNTHENEIELAIFTNKIIRLLSNR